MLYMIRMANYAGMEYRDGQDLIVHLESDLYRSVNWAEANGRKWAFTLSNAGSYYFKDYCDLAFLDKIDWSAVEAKQWSGRDVPSSIMEHKQAEFLIERSFAWELVERIGVQSQPVYHQTLEALRTARYQPSVAIMPAWYY